MIMTNKKNFFSSIKRKLLKTFVLSKDVLNPKHPLRQEEIYCSKICLSLITNSESHLTMSPISQKRFIKNENKDIFIIIHNRLITIINNVYGYNLVMEDTELYHSILKKFDVVLERKRQNLENEMKNNIQNSLKTILNGLENIHESNV